MVSSGVDYSVCNSQFCLNWRTRTDFTHTLAVLEQQVHEGGSGRILQVQRSIQKSGFPTIPTELRFSSLFFEQAQQRFAGDSVSLGH